MAERSTDAVPSAMRKGEYESEAMGQCAGDVRLPSERLYQSLPIGKRTALIGFDALSILGIRITTNNVRRTFENLTCRPCILCPDFVNVRESRDG